MPALLEISAEDLEKAQSQLKIIREMLAEENIELQQAQVAADADEIAISERQIASLEKSIEEIVEEGRKYYYLLHPVPRPALCLVCNFNPINKNVVLKDCPECDGPIKNNRPHPEAENWICCRWNDELQEKVFFTENADEEPNVAGVEEI